MITIGRHLLMDLYGCDAATLAAVEPVRRCMLTAAQLINATIVGEIFHQFSPDGVTGVVAIAESHLSIHTWPESRYASLDIFTCGTLDPTPGLHCVADRLQAKEFRLLEIIRGAPDDLAAHSERYCGPTMAALATLRSGAGIE